MICISLIYCTVRFWHCQVTSLHVLQKTLQVRTDSLAELVMEILQQFLERVPGLLGMVPRLNEMRLGLGIGVLVEREPGPKPVVTAEQGVEPGHGRLDAFQGRDPSLLGDLPGGFGRLRLRLARRFLK